MKRAIFLIAALAIPAFAQEPMVSPVRLESITSEATKGEVRIDIDTSAPAEPSASVAGHGRSLTLEFPGVDYGQSGRRIVVNREGVKDLLILSQHNPPWTRITVRVNQLEPYRLSKEGNRVSLHIGAAVGKAQARQMQSGPVPAARGGPIDRIFRRSPKRQVYETAPRPTSAPNESAAVPLPTIHMREVPPQEGPPDRASAPVPVISASETKLTTASQAQDTSAKAVNGSPITTDPRAADTQRTPAGVALPGTFSAQGSLPVVRTAPLKIVAAASLPAEETAATVAPLSAAADVKAGPVVPNRDLRTLFHVKFVQQDAAYIDAGRNEGIAEGMKLLVVAAGPNGDSLNNTSAGAVIAELTVVGIAETSAVTEIHAAQRNVVPGDIAYLSDTDLQALVQQQSLSSTRKYPAVISFTDDDDALDQEARIHDVPRPPLPSVNRMEGRIGFDYFGTHSLDASQANGRDLGVVLRANFTRIGGTYWNFQGYYNGTIDSTSAASQATLQQLINRTYQLGLTFDNPSGHWVAGFGRLYLPWASSLDTIDGGYVGGRIRPGITMGIFAGSTPDPTSWNYSPNRQISGTFVNFTGGSFDAFHYSSTSGVGISLLSWKIDRPFVFLENSLSYRRSFSVFSAVQADSPAGNAAVAAPGAGIGSSFFSMRWSPVTHLQFDFNHTYFRDIPTFDPTLVGTGLLDKYLFQGFSGGARVDLVKQIAVYTELGRSNRTGDASAALNQMYGITFGRVPWLDLRADVHYSRFNSSFGSGSYQAASLSRSINERLRLEILAGDQSFTSTLAGNQSARFVTATVENDLGAYLFTQGGFTIYRGQQQNYNQWMLMLGYRFDSKWRRK